MDEERISGDRLLKTAAKILTDGDEQGILNVLSYISKLDERTPAEKMVERALRTRMYDRLSTVTLNAGGSNHGVGGRVGATIPIGDADVSVGASGYYAPGYGGAVTDVDAGIAVPATKGGLLSAGLRKSLVNPGDYGVNVNFKKDF